MKLLVINFFVFVLICDKNVVNSGVVKDILGTVHKTRENVRNTFISRNKNLDKNESEDVIHFEDDNAHNQYENNKLIDEKNEQSKGVSTSTVRAIQSTIENVQTNDTDGRENFAGGCISGYKRTSDGRCKPTF